MATCHERPVAFTGCWKKKLDITKSHFLVNLNGVDIDQPVVLFRACIQQSDMWEQGQRLD